MINFLLAWKPKVIAAAMGISLSTMFVFTSVVVFQTLSEFPDPVAFQNTETKAFVEDGDTILIYQRPMTGLVSTEFILERTISCNYDNRAYVYDLPSMYKKIAFQETIRVERIVHFPIALPIGTKCKLETGFRWSPAFSMSSRFKSLPDVPFDITSPPLERK